MKIKKLSEWKPFSRTLLFVVFLPALWGAVTASMGCSVATAPLLWAITNVPFVILFVALKHKYDRP